MQVAAGSRETTREQPLASRLSSSAAAAGSTTTSSVIANAQTVAAACEVAGDLIAVIYSMHAAKCPYLDFETSIAAHTAMEPKHMYIYLRSPQKVLHALHVLMHIASISNFTIFGPEGDCIALYSV